MNRIPAIALIATGACLVAMAPQLRADKKSAESLALLARARASEDLRADGGRPFTLRAVVNFVNGKDRLAGAYTLTWLSENRWHEELRIAGFERVRDGVRGGYRQVRSEDAQPVVVFDIDYLLNVAAITRLKEGQTPGKIHSRKIDGAAASCVDIHSKDDIEREACFDSGTGLLLHTDTASMRDRTTIDYARIVAVGEKSFPTQLRMTKIGGYSIEISVSSIEPITADAVAMPVPDPAHSEFWATCRDVVGPKVTAHVAPKFPEVARQSREGGAVYIYAEIEPDGTLSHLKPLGYPSVDLAKAALEAVGHSTFSPASCHGVPIRSEMSVVVVFSASP